MELFATYSAQGEALGLLPRDEVHRTGKWHRSVQVFLFDQAGRLLIQRRAHHKDLYANLWDYSVGEHLQPDEDTYTGAARGLLEELGVQGVSLTPLLDERWVEFSGTDYIDREIQQAFQGTYEGPLQLDANEVAEVQYIELSQLARWIEQAPEQFTPWFVIDLRLFGFVA